MTFIDDGYDIEAKVCGVKNVGHIENLLTLFHNYKKLIISIGEDWIRPSEYYL